MSELTEAQAIALAEALELQQVRQGMFLIRLAEIDLHDRLHQRIIQSLQACGPGASDGELITAMRFVFGHEMSLSGDEAATEKIAAERMLGVEAGELHRESGISRTEAKRVIEGEPRYWEHRRQAERMLQRQRYCREMLHSLQAALDNHRTDRADQRAADQWHAQTAT